jgi:hypothetical protein
MAVLLDVSPPGDDSTSEIEDTPRSIRVVNATITATGDAGEVFESVTATIDRNEPNVQITAGIDSVTIVGKYADPFLDTFTYVSKGSSNRIETPKTISGVENMPAKKELYELSQDTRADSIRTYTVKVISDLGTETFTVTHKIYNEWEGIRSFMNTYYD